MIQKNVIINVLLIILLTACGSKQSNIIQEAQTTETDIIETQTLASDSVQSEINLSSESEYLTIAETVELLYEMAGAPITPSVKTLFNGNSCSKYENALSWACSKNLLDNCDNSIYYADEYITYEQLASLLYSYTYHDRFPEIVYMELGFSEEYDISDWASRSVEWAYWNEIMGSIFQEPEYEYKEYVTRVEVEKIWSKYETFRKEDNYGGAKSLLFTGLPANCDDYFVLNEEDCLFFESMFSRKEFVNNDISAISLDYVLFLNKTEYQISFPEDGSVQFLSMDEYGLGNIQGRICTDINLVRLIQDTLQMLVINEETEQYIPMSIGIRLYEDYFTFDEDEIDYEEFEENEEYYEIYKEYVEWINGISDFDLFRKQSTHYEKIYDTEFCWDIIGKYDDYLQIVTDALNDIDEERNKKNAEYLSVENYEYSKLDLSFFDKKNVLAIFLGNASNSYFCPILTDVKCLEDNSVETHIVIHPETCRIPSGTGSVFLIPISKEIDKVNIHLVEHYSANSLTYFYGTME